MFLCTWPWWSPRGAPSLMALQPTPDPDRCPPVGTCSVRLLLRMSCYTWPPSWSPRGAHERSYCTMHMLRCTWSPSWSRRFPPVGLTTAHAPLYLTTLVVPTWRPTPHGSSANTGSGQIPAGRSYCACVVVPVTNLVVPRWRICPLQL
jgi:hypothetical protein